MDHISLTLTDDLPVYQQLANYFMNLISSGQLKIGEALPTELSLCDDLNISRATVRQAFQLLEQEGRIVRHRRKGSFVCEPKLKRNLNNLYNFSTEMRSMGIAPSSKVISFDVTHAPPHIAEVLNIELQTPVYRICRLRMADNTPLLLETAYIPTFFCPDLTSESLNDSLYAIISETSGSLPSEASEVYEAINLNSKEATLLQCASRDAALKITRCSKNTAGQTFEYCTIIARGDRNKYQIILRNNGIQYTRVL